MVEDPETNQALEVQRGKVRWWHSKDREEVYRKAIELRCRRAPAWMASHFDELSASGIAD